MAITAIEWDGIVCGHRGFITYVAVNKVRRKRDPGRCFIKAGFKFIRIKEKTKHGPMARFEMSCCEVTRCVQEFLRPLPIADLQVEPSIWAWPPKRGEEALRVGITRKS